jgi:hypothetical protein
VGLDSGTGPCFGVGLNMTRDAQVLRVISMGAGRPAILGDFEGVGKAKVGRQESRSHDGAQAGPMLWAVS